MPPGQLMPPPDTSGQKRTRDNAHDAGKPLATPGNAQATVQVKRESTDSPFSKRIRPNTPGAARNCPIDLTGPDRPSPAVSKASSIVSWRSRVGSVDSVASSRSDTSASTYASDAAFKPSVSRLAGSPSPSVKYSPSPSPAPRPRNTSFPSKMGPPRGAREGSAWSTTTDDSMASTGSTTSTDTSRTFPAFADQRPPANRYRYRPPKNPPIPAGTRSLLNKASVLFGQMAGFIKDAVEEDGEPTVLERKMAVRRTLDALFKGDAAENAIIAHGDPTDEKCPSPDSMRRTVRALRPLLAALFVNNPVDWEKSGAAQARDEAKWWADTKVVLRHIADDETEDVTLGLKYVFSCINLCFQENRDDLFVATVGRIHANRNERLVFGELVTFVAGTQDELSKILE